MIFDISFQLINVNNVQKKRCVIVFYCYRFDRENKLTTFDIVNVNFFTCLLIRKSFVIRLKNSKRVEIKFVKL